MGCFTVSDKGQEQTEILEQVQKGLITQVGPELFTLR